MLQLKYVTFIENFYRTVYCLKNISHKLHVRCFLKKIVNLFQLTSLLVSCALGAVVTILTVEIF